MPNFAVNKRCMRPETDLEEGQVVVLQSVGDLQVLHDQGAV